MSTESTAPSKATNGVEAINKTGRIKTELHEFANRRGTEYPYNDNLEVDVLIVGAGFGGVFCLHQCREAGFKAVIYEAGKGYGGTWRWNNYPGARVDSEVPEYELNIPGMFLLSYNPSLSSAFNAVNDHAYTITEVWKDWTWTTNYPDHHELRAYFDHANKVLNLEKDTAFESVVVDAEFNIDEGKWHVKTADGRTARSKFLIVAAGFAAKRSVHLNILFSCNTPFTSYIPDLWKLVCWEVPGAYSNFFIES